jgi:hypothetical protein
VKINQLRISSQLKSFKITSKGAIPERKWFIASSREDDGGSANKVAAIFRSSHDSCNVKSQNNGGSRDQCKVVFAAVLRIQIRIRIHMFLGLLDPDQLVRGTDPDPSIIKNSEKNLDFYCFVTSFRLFIFEK